MGSEYNDVFNSLIDSSLTTTFTPRITRRTLDVPSLEEAYTKLMTTRDDNLYISSDEGGLTEEDVLCNTHLRTASLFKGYNDELKKLQESHRILINDEDHVSKSVKDLNIFLENIKAYTKKYHPASTDSLDGNMLIMNRSVGSLELSILNEIQTSKSILEAKIDKITKKLNTLRSLIQVGLDELVDKESANNKKLCAICFDREVDTVMIPCGHTSCNGCSNYNTVNKCMTCRSIIQKRVKLFFSA
jgi:hypothetical protein